MVRPAKRLLDRYKERDAWEGLSPVAMSELFSQVAPVVEVPGQDEMAKRFDLLMLNLQLAVAEKGPEEDRLFRQLYLTAGPAGPHGEHPGHTGEVTLDPSRTCCGR